MSFNPVRAKNFYKTGRKRLPQQPHAGVKHSDIMRKQGLGATLPQHQRVVTTTGYAALIHGGDGFTFRHQLLASGNASGVGVNAGQDRVYYVTRGVLYVIIQDENGQQDYLQVQEGGNFSAPAGVRHGIATSGTSECSLLIVEDSGYEANWQQLSEGTHAEHMHPLEAAAAPEAMPYVLGSGDAVPSGRREDQSKAKEQATLIARRKQRRQPKKMSAAGRPAAGGQQGQQSITGAVRVGRNAATNANSSNVDGVSPMPDRY